MRVCCRCATEKNLSEFYKHPRGREGYSAYCIACDKAAKADYYQRKKTETLARVARWQAENSDAVRGYKRDWKRRNPDKLTEYKHVRRGLEGSGGRFTAKEWRALCERHGNVCLSCKVAKPLTVDHVVPLCAGGSNLIENIQPLCMDCNNRKGKRTVDYR